MIILAANRAAYPSCSGVIYRVGQKRIYTPYVNRIYMVLANPSDILYYVGYNPVILSLYHIRYYVTASGLGGFV